MSGNPHELQSLRSLSPVSSQHPAAHDAGPSASGSEFENTNARHRYSSKLTAQTRGITGHGQNQPRLSLHTRLVENSWALEVLAWLLGAGTLAILIIVLAVFNGKPLCHWHSSISVNTLVNVLTTIASTALIFPVASSIAQLRWLWLRKKERSVADFDSFGAGPVTMFVMVFKHPTILLAYLGTINVIFVLLFGPITQETIGLPSKQRQLGNSTGSIATSMTYQVANPSLRVMGSCGEQTRDGTGSIGYASVVRRMGTAIDLAIIGTPADPSDVKADCHTGNCTFGLYSTMGICSRVDDVTPNVVKSVRVETTAVLRVAHPPWRENNLTTGGVAGNPPYTLWIGASDMKRPQFEQQYTFPNPNTLTEFYVVYVSDTKVFTPDSDADFSNTVVALKGGLDLCVYQYDTTVINGTTKTVEKARSIDSKWEMVDKNSMLYHPEMATENIGWTTRLGEQFTDYLGLEIFRGSNSDGTNVKNIGDGAATAASDAAQTFADLLVNKPRSEGQDGLRKMLDNLAIGMTNALRTTSDLNSTTAGFAQAPQVHIAVQFRWLIVPIASVILSLILLSAVIFETARSGVPAWKMSSIGALLSLDHDAGSAIASQDHNRPLDERARDLTLRLKQGGDQQWILEVNN
ncbi:MAG: hypothetical protein Q9163_000034 [Psora crenata]